MAEPFSTNDVYYRNATSCDTTNSSYECIFQDTTDQSKCECKYKENVDKLKQIGSSSGLSKEQHGDLTKERTLLIFNNISLGIGIVGMMWIIYSNSV
jgi:hypothetical protein